MLELNQALYQCEIENLSNTQINLLKAIVNGVEQLTSIKTIQNYKIGTPQNVVKNIRILEKYDFIEKLSNCLNFYGKDFEG